MFLPTDDRAASEAHALLDLSKPSLAALSHVLRHRELWPQNFRWRYSSCQQCAMGLAHSLWSEVRVIAEYPVPNTHKILAAMFNMRTLEAWGIFIGLNRGMPTDSITPEMVADEIDAYLAGR